MKDFRDLKKGDFICTNETGLVQVISSKAGNNKGTQISTGLTVEFFPLDSSLKFIKKLDPSLSVPVDLLSSSELREVIRKLTNVKELSKTGGLKKKKKQDSKLLADMVSGLKDGSLSLDDLLKEVD